MDAEESNTSSSVQSVITYTKPQPSAHHNSVHLTLANNQCYHSGRCVVHSKPLRNRFRPKYYGFHIPIEISRPIRAGILLKVDRGQLSDLIVELMKVHPISFPI